MNDSQCIAQILDFWFGELDSSGMPDPARQRLWFQSSKADDQYIETRFATWVQSALGGELQHWPRQTGGLTALILLLDQFPRNIYRGTAAAFSGDSRALALASSVVADGDDRAQPAIYRVFLYLPFEHSEDLASQDQGVALFDQLLMDCDISARERITDFRRYAVAHRDVIAQFGRFPHRNTALERDSSEAELNHLQTHGGF